MQHYPWASPLSMQAWLLWFQAHPLILPSAGLKVGKLSLPQHSDVLLHLCAPSKGQPEQKTCLQPPGEPVREQPGCHYSSSFWLGMPALQWPQAQH